MKKRLRFKKRYLVWLLLLIGGLSIGNKTETEHSESDFWWEGLARSMAEGITQSFLPLSEQKGVERQSGGNGMEFFLKEFPIMVQAVPDLREPLAAKEKDGETVSADRILTEKVSGDTGLEDRGVKENGKQEDIFAGMLAENGGAVTEPSKNETSETEEEGEETLAGFLAENGVGAEKPEEVTQQFQKREKINSFDFEALKEYRTLVSTFYTIDGGTTAGSNQLNLETLLSKDMRVSKEDPGPQILIYHTHSKEGFVDSEPGEKSQTVVGVGEHLAEILTEKYGYGVLHHTEEYDTVRDDAYAKSLPGLQQVLEENPTIQVVIDLHRDAGVEGVHRVVNLDGKPTATFMLFNGLSRTKKTGDISYLYNPYQEENLAFSFQMQVKAGEYYPGLTRKIYLKGYRYNMHLIPKTLLIELGDSNNTLEEAMNTCEPLAHILDMVLSGQE